MTTESSKFRPHQVQAIQTTIQNNFESGVHFHTTGAGKSWVALQIIIEYQKRNPSCNILWICEQKSILQEQFDKNILKQRGFQSIHDTFLVLNYSHYKDQAWPSVVNSSYVWKKPILVIINRAFLISGLKYKQLQIPIHLIIHDECHSISNRTTKDFYDWILKNPISCIGFSATPNTKLDPFTKVITHYSIYEAFMDQIIVPSRIQWWKSDSHLSFYDIGLQVQKQIQMLHYKKIIVWCGMIEHAYQIEESWRKIFPEFYLEVDTSKDNTDITEFYHRSNNAILFCAAKHREGSDIPYLDGCVFLDKVEDRTPRTFIQCIGRVLRKDPEGHKKFGLIIDVRASSSMDVINRIQPYISPEIKFPWKYTTSKSGNVKIHQIDMIPYKDKSESLSSDHPTIDEMKIKFIRDIPDEPEYITRLEEELKMFEEKKLFPYLLRALDILGMTQNMPHVTRGSCGSSLVCYLLGISHVDPVRYNISFARFLNVHRNTLPDIDFDFPYHLRKDVFFKLEEKYPNKIARISNHVYYHDKSAIRQAIRSAGFNKFIAKHDISNFMKVLTPEMRQKIEDKTKELEGTFRTYSLHCGGIVYYPDGVPDEKVLHRDRGSVLKQITLNKEEVAKEKHFKIDILSSRALAVIMDIVGSQSICFENPILDDHVFDMLCRGDNIGVTLAESPLMRKTLMKFKPRSIADLAMCLSVIRPAAKDARNADPEEIEENEDELFIYDDDAIKTISKITGCSEGDADKYRRIFTKSDKKGKEEFRKMLENINIQDDEADQLFLCLKQLTKYSFCKSHAFSYAQLVYQLAYYKYHRPKEFWKGVLNHSESSYKKWVHLYEAQVAGLDTTSKGASKKEVSIFAHNRRNKIYELQTPLEQLKKYGYWTFVGDAFFPGCYCFRDSNTNQWKINGIIASIRIINKSKDRSVCILFLGVEKKKYIEVVLHNLKFAHSKWVGCKITAKLKDTTQQIYEAEKFYFY
jgi:hypothetical protein